MAAEPSPLAQLRSRLQSGTAPRSIVAEALARTNSNAGHNVYLDLNPDRALAAADHLAVRFAAPAQQPPLYGMPVSLKDCFDLAGSPTSCGSRFYAEANGTASKDSGVAARLKEMGAVLLGKTNLHQLAYGITGENTDYGDCAQPRNAAWLTGGSSSGAAASVQEGSAVAAIGTDTGGSIRVPAALCGLAGYRASLDLAHRLGLWQGGKHLARSFDTLGWLYRDLRDTPLLARALFGLEATTENFTSIRIGSVDPEFLADCEPRVLEVFHLWKQRLQDLGATITTFSTEFWGGALDIFARIQAHEAAAIHHGHFAHFEKPIADRLAWGESLSEEEVTHERHLHTAFRTRMDALMQHYDFLIAPCAPISSLAVHADHSPARNHLLRYTTPISLAGMPVVALPGNGGGVQLIAVREADARLVAYAAFLGETFPVAGL
jgi:aspartyl-tRNA(Asn)/glutamyl-tRNA(Gln) amidotransferase subunit A